MTVTKAALDEFHEFAHRLLDSESRRLSWDELLIRWQSTCERDAINTAIREGLADVDAGRYQTADEAMAELHAELESED